MRYYRLASCLITLLVGCSQTIRSEKNKPEDSGGMGGSSTSTGGTGGPGGEAGAPPTSDGTGGDRLGTVGGSGGMGGDGSGGAGGTSGGSGGSEVQGSSGGSAGSGGSGQSEAPIIETEELPPGDFNAPYRFLLEASGGVGDLVFSLGAGALPDGVELSREGELSGTPIEGGSFTFTVEVEDERGTTASVELELSVRRKRWLAYSADAERLGQYLLYLADLTSALFPSTLVSTGVPETGTVSGVAPHFKFSADGSKLAYALDPGDGLLDLYVIDLTQDVPSEPRQVNDVRPVSHLFDLSPDGRYVAFAAEVGSGVWEARAVDVSGAEPAEPNRLGEATQWDMLWINDELLAYSSPDGVRWHRRTNSGFTEAQTIPLTEGSFAAANPETEQLLLLQAVQFCARAGYLVDFAEASYLRAPANGTYRWATYNDQLSYVTHPDDNGGFLVYDTSQMDEPLGIISPTSASCQAVWSPGGSRVLHLNPDEMTRLLLSNVSDEGVSTYTVGGAYGDVQDATNATFLTDDRIVFTAEHQLLMSVISNDAPLDAVPLNPDQPDTALSQTPAVSANAVWVVFARSPDDGNSGPFAVDVSGSTPSGLRPLRTANLGYVSSYTFSPDSSRLAFLETNGSGGPSLYVADMLHATALGRAVLLSSCPDGGTGSSGCHSVQAFRFQP